MTLLLDEAATVRRPVGVVEVRGPDRLSYLHTMLTQHLESARPGTAADFCYLDPKGNAVAVGRALVADADVLLVTPSAEIAAALGAALEKFKFLTQVEVTDVSDGWALLSVRGPTVIEHAAVDAEPLQARQDGPGWVVRDRSGGLDLVGPERWVTEQEEALGLPAAGPAQWEVWRIANAEPGWGSEIAPGRRLQELGLLPTHVHLRKGCYPGQESVAKTYNLGAPRRALAVLEADAPLAAGGEVEAGGKGGVVTSSAQADDGWVALALLPLVDGELPATVTVGGASAAVRRRVGEGLAIPGA